ncbi:MAG: hypothetical protein ACFHU9_08760 [Fluviicola sp.]
MKNTFRKIALSLLVVCLFVFNQFAQDFQIPETKLRGLENVYEVPGKGYAACYYQGKQSGKERIFDVKFLDYSFSEYNSSKIALHKYAYSTGSAKNDKRLALSFVEAKNKVLKIFQFDDEGEQLGVTDLSFETAFSEDMHSYMPVSNIYPAEGGFLVTLLKKKGLKYSYKIAFITDDMEVAWESELGDPKETVMVHDAVGSKENVYVSYIRGKGMKFANFDNYVASFDASGKMQFEEKLSNAFSGSDEKLYYASILKAQNDRLYVFGSYYDKRSPLGLFGVAFNSEGGVDFSSELKWADHFASKIQFLEDQDEESDKKDKTNVDEDPLLMIGDVFLQEDGSFQLIAETVKKRTVVGASAYVSTGGGGGSIQINTAYFFQDIVAITLDENLESPEIVVIPKKQNKMIVEGVGHHFSFLQQRIKAYSVNNYRLSIANDDGSRDVIYTLRKKFSSELKIAYATVDGTEDKVESNVYQSEIEKLKKIRRFGVLKGEGSSVMVYLHEDDTIKFFLLER